MAEISSRGPRSLVVRVEDRAGLVEESFRHPFNANSEIHGYDLAGAVGLVRAGVTLARVPPHRESYAPHTHATQEEWLFVLRGRGVVDIGNQSFDIAVGDFVGFPAGTYAHLVRNPGDDELAYLCGGDRRAYDVVDYPVAGKRVVQIGADVKVYPARAGEPMFP